MIRALIRRSEQLGRYLFIRWYDLPSTLLGSFLGSLLIYGVTNLPLSVRAGLVVGGWLTSLILLAVLRAAWLFWLSRRRDKCQVCLGARGGVRGNENRIADKIMCDYCTTEFLDQRREAS